MSWKEELSTYLVLTDGMPRERRAQILGVNTKTFWRYEHAEAKPSRRVRERLDKIIDRARNAAVTEDERELERRMETMRAAREARERSSAVAVFFGELIANIPPWWRAFTHNVDHKDWHNAWEYGVGFAETPYIFNAISDLLKPYFLNMLVDAAFFTGRIPEAWDYANRALELCDACHDPLYKTILVNRASVLTRLGRFHDAYADCEACLRVDSGFLLAFFTGLCASCLKRDESEVHFWRGRLTAQAIYWTREEIEQLLEWLSADRDLKWGWERQLLQPLVDHLRTIIHLQGEHNEKLSS